MNFLQSIQHFNGQPLTHQMILSVLKEYKRPNDKIHELLSAGTLQSVRKGLYILNSPNSTSPELFLLANHVFGPSYVSMDSALSFHGLIPERVYELASATTKSTRQFRTSVGDFTYLRLPLPYYSFGQVTSELSVGQRALIALPEKALLDKVVTTRGLLLRSRSAATAYLLENLRMDEGILRGFNLSQMKEWLPCSPKKESVTMVIKAIGAL